MRPTTLRRYRQLVTHQLVPHLGRIPLARLTPSDVEGMLRQLHGAPRSAHHARAVLRTALNRAMRHGLITRNAAALAEAPRVARREAQALDPAQARRLLAALDGHPMRAMFLLAMTSGLRKGELLGLRWSDVDLAGGTLTVRRSLQHIDGRFEAVEPKTEGSRRTVHLPAIAVTALAEHRTQQAAASVVGAYIFTTPSGQPLHGTTVWRTFQAVLAEAGLPAMPFHGLRHTTASLLLAQGVPARVVMELLGHSSIQLTLTTYSHVIAPLEQAAAEQMDALLSGG